MKVNKILKATAVALVATLALSGCIKDIVPYEGAITEGQLSASGAGVETMLKAVPASMAFHVATSYDHSDFGYHSVGAHMDHHALIAFPCVRSDRGGNVFYSRLQAPNYGFDMGSQGGYTHYLWYNYYPFIKNANDVIAAVKKDSDNAEYQVMGAIARTFRALYYLDLARYYEALKAKAPELPQYESGLERVYGLTVPIITEDTTESAAKSNPRATREELFNFIFEDLAYAEGIFKGYDYPEVEEGAEAPKSDIYRSTPTYPTLEVVYGLYARAYLWLGCEDFTNDAHSGKLPTGNDAYAKAAEYARLAIDTAEELAGATLMSEYEWTNPSSGFNTVVKSWLWATVQSTDTVMSNLYAFAAHMCPEASYGYGPLACPGVSETMYNRLQNSDFRKKIIAGPDKKYADFASYTSMGQAEWEEVAWRAPYTNFKFRPNMGERVDYMTANAISLPIMRLEELYFIEMEALCHTGGAAQTLFNEFIATRVSGYVSQGELLDEIIFHKQVEFWGEGIVLFDMKRLNMGVNTTDANYPSGMLFESDGRLPWWNMPIPSGESTVNTAIQGSEGPDPSRGIVSKDAI